MGRDGLGRGREMADLRISTSRNVYATLYRVSTGKFVSQFGASFLRQANSFRCVYGASVGYLGRVGSRARK